MAVADKKALDVPGKSRKTMSSEPDKTFTRQRSGEASLQPFADVEYGILPHHIGFWVRRAQLSIMKSFDAHMTELKLRPVEAAAILIIKENPELSQIVLSSALCTDQSTTVAICTRLEKRGLIARRRMAEDRRYYMLSLTAAGARFAEDVRKALSSHDEAMARNLTAGEKKQLVSLLKALV